MIRIEFDKAALPSAHRDAAIALLDALSGLPVITITAKVYTSEKTTGIEIVSGESRLKDAQAVDMTLKLAEAFVIVQSLMAQRGSDPPMHHNDNIICEECAEHACTCGCFDYDHEILPQIPAERGRCQTEKCPCEKYIHPSDL